MESDVWWLLLLLPPIFFGIGWTVARVDMKEVVRQAKFIPAAFYKALEGLADNDGGRATHELAIIADNMPDSSYELRLTLGRLYRSRGENDKAIRLLDDLCRASDTVGDKKQRALFELGLAYQNAGLVDRAERTFLKLLDGNMAREARELLLHIYQQDRDWEKAVEMAQLLSYDEQTYQFEIAQFHCETAQAALFKSDADTARRHIAAALEANRKCCRANIILGDLEQKQGRYAAAAEAYAAIEKQNHAYLGMVGERIYDAYDAQGLAEEGLDILIGYAKTFPQLNLLDIIYDKMLLRHGEQAANEIMAELVRAKPDLNGAYRLLGLKINDINPQLKADAELMRGIIGRQMQKSWMYRCRHCHFKSQVFFWHCPACSKWETFTPNKIEV
ncbi:MAG: lipopolysaccharide assembly protein LapB [Neisseria sp.]|nr:lipopolysaccharide assembly protein LapB [Neisseria sp.]